MNTTLESTARFKRPLFGGAVLAFTLATLAVVTPAELVAQAGGPGFMFQRPVATISVQGGYAVAGAQSELFDQVTDDLFLGRRDFDAPYVGGTVTVSVGDRWDVVVDAGHSWQSIMTEWRRWEEADGSPVWQTVSFSNTPLTAGARYYLTERGRGIGQFVWIPARVMPWIGVGGGLIRYRFAQEGDFVDEVAEEIFADRLEQVGTAFTTYGAAGIQLRLTRSMLLSGEARYAWARDGLDGSVYDQFEPMDLSGLRFTAGIGFSF